MVVLEAGMLTSSANQYLQPDYLSPLPTTLDAKKSPLALLAQTCSQIGADGPPAKPLSMERPTKKSQRPSSASQESAQKRSSPSGASSNNASGSPSTSPVNSTPPAPTKLAFKPYEANVLSRREDRPPSKSGSENEDRKSAPPQRKSSSPSTSTTTTTPTQSPAAATNDRKSSSPANTSPIIRSGLEVLQGHPKDLPLGTYKPGTLPTAGLTAAQLAQLCCPPGYETTHPAFRPPFAGAAAAAAFSHQQAAALLAAGYGSQAAAAAAAAASPYLGYTRVKTATGVETLVPYCKDPYCTGCPFSMHGAMLAASGAAAAAAGAAASRPCPAGCTQCEHQKWMPPPTTAYPGATAAASAAAHQLAGRPYVCSWIAGESYCGKSFASSDELLQHLRNHTSLAPGAPGASSAAAAAAAAAAASSSYSSARFHPYSKPGFPAGLPASPYSAFNPTALGPYYSPYALYGQRIGAAVHP